MPDNNKVTQTKQREKTWYVDNWDIEANNNTYYSIKSDAAAAQIASTPSYISFYSEKDFKSLKVKENSEKLKLLSENFPFFQRVSGDGLCGFHAAIVATLAKCADNPKLLKIFRKNLEQYSENCKDNESKIEVKKTFSSILKKLPEDNLTFDRFYELVSEEGQDNISKKLATILFKNADFSPKVFKNPFQTESIKYDLEAQKEFLRDPKKAKILVSDFSIIDIMKSISPFKIKTVTSENLEDFFGHTAKDTIYIVNGDGKHFDILYSKSDENIIKASQKVIQNDKSLKNDNNINEAKTAIIPSEEYEKRIKRAKIDQFNSVYRNESFNQKERKISFAKNDQVIEFNITDSPSELQLNSKYFSDQKRVQSNNLYDKALINNFNKVATDSATVRISEEEYQKRINSAKIDKSNSVDSNRILDQKISDYKISDTNLESYAEQKRFSKLNEKKDTNNVNNNKFEKKPTNQKAIEVLVKPTDEQKDGYKIFDNKLIRALDKTHQEFAKIGKGKEKEVWKSLTTLDKRVLVESYNKSHEGSEINFDSLFRVAKQGEKAELTVKSENYVFDESKISDLKKVLDYAASLKSPNSTFQKTDVISFKGKNLGTSIAQ